MSLEDVGYIPENFCSGSFVICDRLKPNRPVVSVHCLMVVVIFSFFRCEHLGLTLQVWACLGQVVYADTIGINQIRLMSTAVILGFC